MTALATLDLPDGTSVATRDTGGSVLHRWSVAGDQLVDTNGRRVDKWFFSGLIEEGKVFEYDSRPPEVDEWFGYGGSLKVVVLSVETKNGVLVANCASFRHDRYQQFSQEQNLLDNYIRISRPEWATEQYMEILRLFQSAELSRRELASQTSHLRNAVRNLEYAKSYLDSAISMAKGDAT